MLLDIIKGFYSKDDFDYKTDIVHPYKFHTIFYRIMKSFQVVDDEPVPMWTYFLKTFLTVCAIIGLCMSIFSTYYGLQIQDLPLLTEAGIYFILFTNELIILSLTKINLSEYHALLQVMREDFHYICTTGSKYRKRFFANHLVTWKVSILSVVLITSIGIGTVGLATSTLLLFLAKSDKAEEKRPLLFPLWSPYFDFGDTPYYEVAFVTFNIVPCAFAYAYIFYILIAIIWIRHIMLKADLVIWSIQDLMQDIKPGGDRAENNAWLLKRRLRDIIIKHDSTYKLLNNYAAVYKKLLLFTQELYAPVTCFTAYSAVVKLDAGELNCILIMLCLSSMVLTFIPSYLCTIMSEKLLSVSDACWTMPFWGADINIRPYAMLIIQRSRRPLPIQAAGLQETSIETFSQKTATAYSMFNMLRQLH